MSAIAYPPHRVFVTGDDFGASRVVNEAIERYHRAGALHCASLMVDGPCVEEAVEIARRNPELRVGLHLTLCEHSPAMAGLRYAFSPGARRALPGEIRRQFEKFAALGFPPLYWDGHTHLHLHPVVLRHTVPVAHAMGFRFTRLVREPGAPGVLPWIFERLSRAAMPVLARHGIGHADRVCGLRRTGKMDETAFAEALDAMPEDGTSEVYFHPGVDPAPEAEWLAVRLRAREGPAFHARCDSAGARIGD